jgi:AraC-like DNA-binding protein
MAEIETSPWEVHAHLPLSASVLYPLAPLGVGTPLVESLTSYLKRLAHAHHLKVADLVMFCSTQTDAHVLPSTLQKLSRIDGMTDSGQAWSALVRDLTCQENVVCLTMNYWRSLLNPYRMLRQHHAWCPLCFADAARREMLLYEPLAWRLLCVEVCTVHQRPLVEKCPTCGSQFMTLLHWAAVGYCPKCQGWLGDSAPVDQTPPCGTEVSRRASAVGRLLSLAPRMNRVPWNDMAEVILLLRQAHRTTYTYLEQVLQTSTTALSTLLARQGQPNLDVFARLAAFSGEAFWKALTQPTPRVPVATAPPENNELQIYLDQLLTSPQRLPSLRSIARRCGFATVAAFRKAFPMHHNALWQRVHAEQHQVLEQALQQEPPVVLTKWAEQHGYRTGDLYHHFYDLCLQVTQRFHADKEQRCRHYLEQTLNGEHFPAFKQICQTLKVSDHYLKQHFAAELQVIEARRRQQLEHMETFVREYLDRMLAQDEGSVSLEQIARVVGKSTRYLKDNFPSQSRTLLSRRRAYLAKQVQATCDHIRETVFDLHRQGIYPSVDRIHAVIDSWMVHGKAYRHAYIEAMTMCGYLSASTQHP